MWPRAPGNAAQHRLELLVEAPARPPVATAPALPPPCTWPGFLTHLHDFCLRLARISDQNYRLKSWEEARTTPAYNLPHLQLSCLRILLAQIVMPNRVYKSYSCTYRKREKVGPFQQGREATILPRNAITNKSLWPKMWDSFLSSCFMACMIYKRSGDKK